MSALSTTSSQHRILVDTADLLESSITALERMKPVGRARIAFDVNYTTDGTYWIAWRSGRIINTIMQATSRLGSMLGEFSAIGWDVSVPLYSIPTIPTRWWCAHRQWTVSRRTYISHLYHAQHHHRH